MARWKLTSKHYLNVPGTEWEYREIGNTGRQKRQIWSVPLFLDPDYEADCNYAGDRWNPPYIVVCHEGKGEPADIVFVGVPTPDMEPLDDEARAISAAESKNWVRPMEVVDVNNFGNNLIEQLTKQMAQVQMGQPIQAAPGELDQLKGEMAKLAAEKAEMQAQLEALTAAQQMNLPIGEAVEASPGLRR